MDEPVFIVGSPRSGTTLLYHMLLSTSRFLNYRSELHAYSIIGPKFGQLANRRDRIHFLRQWLRSTYCKKTGIPPAAIQHEILHRCSSAGGFLNAIMRLMAEQQGIGRWAECTPANVFHLQQIHNEFPCAKFVHMIRDGRDVALSLARQKWIEPLPWHKQNTLEVAALFWQRNVQFGQRMAEALGEAYYEIRFEDLVSNTSDTLEGLSTVIGEELDWNQIQENPIGSVSRPNTSFDQGDKFNPIARWRTGMSEAELAAVERLVGDTLKNNGYELASNSKPNAGFDTMWATYNSLWSIRHWLRSNSVIGRFSDTDLIRQ